MKDDRFPADDDVTDTVAMQQRDELPNVRREVSRVYFLGRWHARTSGEERPWTRNLSSRAARQGLA